MRKFFTFLLMVGTIGACYAQEKPTVFKGATIIPIVGDPIPNGVLVVHQGKIVSVGGSDSTTPKDAVVIDVTGKTIMPGIVDTHSHIGGPAGGDRSNALNPEVRVLDSVDPESDDFKRALAGGLTTVNIMPGSGHLLSGQTIYVKLREGRQIEDILLTTSKGVTGGLKMANGTNSLRGTAGFPGTRGKSAAMMRELYVKAQEYKAKVEKAKDAPDKMPERDLRMETLVEVLDGKRIVHFHTHKTNDILTAIRISNEFKIRAVLHHVSEGWKVADLIAESKLPCSIIVVDSPGGKMEAMQLSPITGAYLEKAGVLTGFHTDDYVTDSRFFLRSPAIAVREGMSRTEALKAMTINGAKMLDLDHRVGSLEKGKDADFIILSGDPLSVYTRVEQTWVEGVKRFDFAIPADRAFALGGYRAFSPETNGHDHCE